MNSNNLQQSMTLGSFRRLALERTQESISRLNDKLSASTSFVKRNPTPLLSFKTIPELVNDSEVAFSQLVAAFPDMAKYQKPLLDLIDRMAKASSALLLLHTFNEYLVLESTWFPADASNGPSYFGYSADELQVYITTSAQLPTTTQAQKSRQQAVDEDVNALQYLAGMSDLAQQLRDIQRGPTAGERTALEVGYALLDRGVRLPTDWQSLGVTGFRSIQTWLSLADPGPGHLDVTTTRNDLLHGTIVHVEHIDRDEQSDKEKVEPYRLPASRHAAWVRMHVGSKSPTTAFIGRPVFENQKGVEPASSANFNMDLLKTVHMHASACSAMFRNGIADCKIGIERMTSSQAITFMKAVVGNVHRDRERQYLSAAFNINTPLSVDHDGTPRVLKDRMEIALMGIEIARLGGFDKVTWDGASNQIPSVPITQQLTVAQLVELVHRAHEAGLETYISAGMEAPDMATSAYIGVDGVGIGTSMHYIDPQTKLMGQLKPDAILGALKYRDDAAPTDLAKAAKLLARLDVLSFEGALVGNEDTLRNQLYEAVKAQDANRANAIRAQLGRVEGMPDASPDTPRSVQVARLLQVARRDGGAGHLDDSSAERLNSLIQTGDTEELSNLLNTLREQKEAA